MTGCSQATRLTGRGGRCQTDIASAERLQRALGFHCAGWSGGLSLTLTLAAGTEAESSLISVGSWIIKLRAYVKQEEQISRWNRDIIAGEPCDKFRDHKTNGQMHEKLEGDDDDEGKDQRWEQVVIESKQFSNRRGLIGPQAWEDT